MLYNTGRKKKDWSMTKAEEEQIAFERAKQAINLMNLELASEIIEKIGEEIRKEIENANTRLEETEDINGR